MVDIWILLILVTLPFLPTKADTARSLDYLKNEKGVEELVTGSLYSEKIADGEGEILEGNRRAQFHVRCVGSMRRCIVDTKRAGRPLNQDLNIALPYFTKGVAGMKVGEKRRLYVGGGVGGFDRYLFRKKDDILTIEVELITIE